jgi:hypothetical protein
MMTSDSFSDFRQGRRYLSLVDEFNNAQQVVSMSNSTECSVPVPMCHSETVANSLHESSVVSWDMFLQILQRFSHGLLIFLLKEIRDSSCG